MRLADVLRSLINDELFVPLAIVVARDAHIMERGAHRQDEVHFMFVIDISFRVKERYGLFVCDSGLFWVAFCQVFARFHVYDVHTDEGMDHDRVQLQVASLFDCDLHAELLLMRLVKLILQLERRLYLSEEFSWCLLLFAAIKGQGETITHRIL